jgi:hypothetical protein
VGPSYLVLEDLRVIPGFSAGAVGVSDPGAERRPDRAADAAPDRRTVSPTPPGATLPDSRQ